MERKIFNKDEMNYISFALEKIGCYGIDDKNKEYQCPYWDWELKNEENAEGGDCSIKHTKKLCILLKVAADDVLSLVLRDKTSEDFKKEKEQMQQKGLGDFF